MLISKVLYFYCVAVSLFLYPGPAEALELRVSSENAHPGDSIAVDITVKEYNQEAVATAAFTVTYSADNMVLNGILAEYYQWKYLYSARIY
jgi:hypothetical protein